MKYDSLKIYDLASDNCFSHKKRLPKGSGQHIVKKVNHFFWGGVKKLEVLYSSNHTIVFKFHQHVVQILIK